MIDDSINHEYIIRYIRSVLKKREGITAEMEQFAREHDVPISQPETVKLLELLVRISGARQILEVGCAIGYSAVCMAQAGAEHIDTIELNSDAVRAAKRNIAAAGFANVIHVHEGDAKDILPMLDGEYDMVFIDAAKAQYNEFFGHCMRLLRHGGILASDNVLYKGMTATDELVLHRKRTIVKRLREYIDMLCGSPELETNILPLGDGIALSFKL